MSGLSECHDYDDIIEKEYIPSPQRSRMSDRDRAAQFSPFAALTGFSGMIDETGVETARQNMLSDGEWTAFEDDL